MRIFKAGLYIAAVVAAAYVNTVSASYCDAYFPFDGSLVDASGNGYDGLMIAEGGAAEPQFGEGRYGQALHLTGKSAMRSFLDLHHERCPQLTITAWFKLPSVSTSGAQAVLSTGASGANPGLVATDSTLRLYGSGNGLSQRNAIRDSNTWYFVAVTFDYDAREYKLHWLNRTVDGRLSDSPYAAEDSFWIGTRSDNLRLVAQDLFIDDVRVYGRVLGADEIHDASTSDAPAQAGDQAPPAPPAMSGAQTVGADAPCNSNSACGTGQYCARDLTCHPETHLPLAVVGTGGTSGSGPTVIRPTSTGPSPIPIRGSSDPARGELEDATGQPAPLQAMETEALDCRIDTNRTLTNRAAAVDYSADCVVDVTAALTIEPGVIIQFAENAGLGVFDNGTIRAVGTEDQPIVLQATSSTRGWWRGVFVGTRSLINVLEHVRIEGAGSNYVYCCRDLASLVLEDAQIALSHVQLSNGGALGLLATGNTDFTRYNGIRITSHDGYAASLAWNVMGSLDGMGSDYSGNAQDFVHLSTDRLTIPATLRPLNVPYLLPGEVVDVTAPLTIDAGTELVVMENGGLGVFDNGTLTAEGTAAAPIVWRGATATRGYWRGIFTETTNSNRLRHVEIRHAGSDYVYCCDDVAALVVRGGRMTLENSTISDSGGCAVYAGPNADFAETGNTFSSNQGGAACYAASEPVAAQDVPQGSCMTGEVQLFSGKFAPRGWAFANGDMLDTQAYSALYSIIGTAYGGDGQTGFALPNIQPPVSETAGSAAMVCVNGVYPSRS
tara:strand:+ start:19331 stop:21667 length:2337 start_codon:yes stop_codon:yes gene_type:complete